MFATPSHNLTVAGALDKLVEKGQLQKDIAQKNAAIALDQLRENLILAFAQKKILRNLLQKARAYILQNAARSQPIVQGLYLWGSPGGGKSMLMQMFIRSINDTACLKSLTRRRTHFLTFMEEVHLAIDSLNLKRTRNPLQKLAKIIANKSKLLCFDEFLVEDIADAMLLGRLFEALVDRGVVLVATSNFSPDQLYKGGLKYQNFKPFVQKLKASVQTMPIHARKDYRATLHKPAHKKTQPDKKSNLQFNLQFNLIGYARAESSLLDVFAHCVMPESVLKNKTITCENRTITLQNFASPSKNLDKNLDKNSIKRGVAIVSFNEICQKPRGVRDYRNLLLHCDLLFISKIPKLGEAQRNSAKRLMRLVDLFYEQRAIILCQAQAQMPIKLYSGHSSAKDFRRTASRIEEMAARMQKYSDNY